MPRHLNQPPMMYKGPRLTAGQLTWKRAAMKGEVSLNKTISTTAPETQFRQLFRLLSLLQVCSISFFAVNQDLSLKLGYSILWILATVLSIVVQIPCLFNCYVDIQVFSSPFQPDTLIILSQIVTLIHALVAGCIAFKVGGDVRRFTSDFSQLCSRDSSRKILSISVYILFASVMAICLCQSYLLVYFSDRRVYRPYTPDKEKLNDAQEGKAPYVWPHTPLFNLQRATYIGITVFFRAVLLVHTRALEVVLVQLSLTMSLSKMLPLKLTMKLRVISAVRNLKKVISLITLVSVTFNLMRIFISGAIVANATFKIYFIPKTYYLDLMQFCEGVFFILLTLTAAFAIKLKMMLFCGKFITVSILTLRQMLIVIVLTGLFAGLIYLLTTSCEYEIIRTDYYPDVTRDWFFELKGVSDELREQFLIEFNETSQQGKYLPPDYFQSKSDQMWDEKEKNFYSGVLN